MVVITWYEEQNPEAKNDRCIILRYHLSVPPFLILTLKCFYIAPLQCFAQNRIEKGLGFLSALSGLTRYYYTEFQSKLIENLKKLYEKEVVTVDNILYPPKLYKKLFESLKENVRQVLPPFPIAYAGIEFKIKNYEEVKFEVGLSIIDDYSSKYCLGARVNLEYLLRHPIDFTIWLVVDFENFREPRNLEDVVEDIAGIVYDTSQSLEELLEKKSKEYEKSNLLKLDFV